MEFIAATLVFYAEEVLYYWRLTSYAFDVLLTVHLSIFISVISWIDAQMHNPVFDLLHSNTTHHNPPDP